jgi:uncharacterized glyoxalase superfamily protein PhnB
MVRVHRFEVIRTNEEDGELIWAKLRFQNSELKLSAGGKASAEERREVDLYITTENIDEIFQRLNHQVQIVEEPHDTFYGMREFILRDCNRFWIALGQPMKAETKNASAFAGRRFWLPGCDSFYR